MSDLPLRIRVEGPVAWLQLNRPDAHNAINTRIVVEFTEALNQVESSVSVVVVEGLPEVFCTGADFQEVLAQHSRHETESADAGLLYDLWHRLARSSFVSVAHVRGRATAGGLGFVAACDIVLAEEAAQFSLSELLFGVPPACVLPFLIRRVGLQRARYMTLSTRPIDALEARQWGLVDACELASGPLLSRHLARLVRLSKPAIQRFRRYAAAFDELPGMHRTHALDANREAFCDPVNLASWRRYVEQGIYPWERMPT
jgi:polyketide biosynthesis enoyl-CoA hydratase PksH